MKDTVPGVFPSSGILQLDCRHLNRPGSAVKGNDVFGDAELLGCIQGVLDDHQNVNISRIGMKGVQHDGAVQIYTDQIVFQVRFPDIHNIGYLILNICR